MLPIILKIINWLLICVGIVGVIGFLVFIPWGIVMLVKSGKETDAKIKNKKILKGILLIVLPFILTIGSLIFITIIQAIKAFL